MFLLQNLVLVALTAVIFWLTFFPLISEAITGTQTSVGPPVFAHFVVPLALVVVALSGIGPIIAWRRVTPAKLRAQLRLPGGRGAGNAACVLAFVPGVTEHVFAYVMFGFGAFVVATVAQEFFRGARARRAMTGESRRRGAGGAGARATDGATAATWSTPASPWPWWAWPRRRRSSTSATATLQAGPERPPRRLHHHATCAPRRAPPRRRSPSAADLAVTKGGHRVTTLHTSYGLYPSLDPMHPIGRFFNTADGAQTESRVGLDAGALRDLWVVISPNLGRSRAWSARAT